MLVTIQDIAELKSYSANLQQIYAYWQAKRGSRLMPRRADLDPAEIPPRLLPGITPRMRRNAMIASLTPARRSWIQLPFSNGGVAIGVRKACSCRCRMTALR
jgi:hypothetical protein